ncbi:LPS-assembly protein LptD [Psittacicella hinzii]|uniref:LPS-assembly protein LptD n=1 Tax=Psittacicella hinzii TaxID=2028575 RepID=A0A3A1YA22_9GAMM|nr:LPS assembly protein LptD [Psittacicella hinzii]RIY34525.1 hypothetical protein CKF58_08140 [Psittacicella hinzii]
MTWKLNIFHVYRKLKLTKLSKAMGLITLGISQALLAHADSDVTTDFAKDLPATDYTYTETGSTTVYSGNSYLQQLNTREITLAQIDRIYPALNYNYYNTFTSQVYDAIRALQIREKFLKDAPKSDGKEYNYNESPIVISADYMFSSENGNVITYTGNTSLIQGDRAVRAQKIIYRRLDDGKQQITLDGEVNLSSNQLELEASQLVLELINDNNANKAQLDASTTTFAVVDTMMHGTAESLESKDNITRLKDSSLYAGPIKALTLNVKAKETQINMNTQRLIFKRATLRIGKVPIFWFPTFSINISGKPETGFKEPSITLNSNAGFMLTVPFVWYVNNNIKYTLRTSYATKLGLLLNNNLDVQSRLGISTLNFSFTPKMANRKTDSNRYYLGLRHIATFNNDYHVALNYRHVSDKYFFNDYYSNTDAYLTSDYSLWYNKDNWSWNLSAYTFQPIYTTTSHSYNSLPELNVSYSQPFAYNKIRYAFSGQLAHLYNDDAPTYTKANRFYLKNSFLYSRINSLVRSDYELATYEHAYHQYNKRTGKYENLFRFTPEFSATYSTKLMRDTLAFNKYAVTVTPSIGYTYRQVNHLEDSRFNNYDSSMLLPSTLMIQNGVYTSGIDSLENANDINLGYRVEYTNKFTGQQKLALKLNFVNSLGKIKYYNPNTESTYTKYKRNLVTSLHYNFNEKYNLDLSTIVDLTKSRSSMGIASINYQPNLTNIVQLSYRFATKQYLQDALFTYDNAQTEKIKQLGFAFIWDINPQLSMLFSNYIDLHDRKLVDRNIAFNYVYYGWSIGVSYERRRIGKNQFENSYDFVLNLVGFNNQYNNKFGRYINSGKIPFVGNR